MGERDQRYLYKYKSILIRIILIDLAVMSTKDGCS